MSRACRICLEPAGDGDDHARCVRRLFGTPRLPLLNIELSKLHTAALAMLGHTSLSGVQKKISVSLSVDRATLQVAVEGGRYLLKPQADRFLALPENEHATTCLARLTGLQTGDCGLVPLNDGSLAYIVARFDRQANGRKVPQEDFCQLAQKSPKNKYEGSAELCVRLLRRYATEPLVEILKLYRQLVFAWWSGNGDMHLKNFSIQPDPEGHQRLTPAYDQICTSLVIPGDTLAMPVQGKNQNLTRGNWLRFADYCTIPRRAADRVLGDLAGALDGALGLIERSFLPPDMKESYQVLLRSRTGLLTKAP